MLRLIPKPLHRLALKAAHALRLFYWRRAKPQLNAAWIIATDIDGKLLLVRTSYGNGEWQLPGGGIQSVEEPIDAAARELREETGCHALNLTSLGMMEDEVVGAPTSNHLFTATVEDNPVPDGREVIDAKFFPLHSLPAPMSGKTKARLEYQRSRQAEANR